MRASVHFACSDDLSHFLFQSISIELKDGPPGTAIDLRIEDGLRAEVTAEDLSGFRAAMHQFLRLSAAAEDMYALEL